MLHGIFHVLDHRIHCFFPFKKPFFPHFNRMNANTHRILGGFGMAKTMLLLAASGRKIKKLKLLSPDDDWTKTGLFSGIENNLSVNFPIQKYATTLYWLIDQKVTGLNFNQVNFNF